MKKISFIVSLLLFFAIIMEAALPALAEAGDVTPPTIHSVIIENHDPDNDPEKVYTGEDTLKVKIKATDNFQISYIYFKINAGNSSEGILYELHDPAPADEYVIEVPLKYYATGEYRFTELEVWDPAYNQTSYEVYRGNYYTFYVRNTSYVAGTPRVTDIKISPDQGNSKKTNFTYTATVEPGGSAKIKNVQINAGQMIGGIQQNTYAFSLSPTGKKNEYSKTVCFKDYIPNVRNVEIVMMTVETDDGKVYLFAPEDVDLDGFDENHFIGIKKKDVTVVLTDVLEDNDNPELISWEYLTPVVYAPDTLKLKVTAKDKTSEPKSVEIWMKKDGDNSSVEGVPFSKVIQSGKTSVFEVSVDFPKYVFEGTAYVSKIRIDDKNGNSGVYSVDDGTLEKKTFEVVDGATADYYTSAVAKDLLEVVGKAADEKGKTVLINVSEQYPIIPKAVFEIIAGKDVTVIFEKMYRQNDGIEWVMYGKHVDKAKAKDINAYVTIVEESWSGLAKETDFKKPNREKKDRFIRIVFANNGELPGKATIRFKPGFTLRGFTNAEDMRLYYLNEETSGVDLVGSNIKTEKTGYFHFNITHNSSYAFVGDYKEGSSGGGRNGGSGNGGSGNGGTAENPDGDTAPEGDLNSETAESGEGSTTTIGALNTEENTEKGGNALTVVIIVLGALALIGGGVFGYFYYKNLKGKKDDKTE